MKLQLLLPIVGFLLALRGQASADAAAPLHEHRVALASPGEGWDIVRNERASVCVEWNVVERSTPTTLTFQAFAAASAQRLVSGTLPAWTDRRSPKLVRAIGDLVESQDSREAMLVVSGEAVATQSTLSGLRLTAFAKALLRASPDRFRAHCGDGAVRSVRTGGRYFAALRFRGSSIAEQASIAEALERAASAVVAGMSLSRALERETSQRFVSVLELREGLRPQATCLEFGCMDATARGLLDAVDGGGLLLERETISYANLLDPRDGLPGPLPVEGALETVRAIARDRAALHWERHRLELAEREPWLAPDLTSSERPQRLADTLVRLDSLGRAEISCFGTLSRCTPSLLTGP